MKPRIIIKERISGKVLGGDRTAEVTSYFFNSAIVRNGVRHSPLHQDQTQHFLSSLTLNDSSQQRAQPVTAPITVALSSHSSSQEEELSQADIDELSRYFPDWFGPSRP